MTRGSSIRVLAAAALLLLGAGAGVAAWSIRAPAAPVAASPTLFSLERDGMRYQYNAISGREYLFDLATPVSDRTDLGASRREDLLRLRGLLETQLGLPSIEILHEPHRATADALRSMGYL